jgi:hypothetical protein
VVLASSRLDSRRSPVNFALGGSDSGGLCKGEERNVNVHAQVNEYIASQPERKRADMHALHGIILGLMPGGRLWFLDGKDESGRTVTNPNIGYGVQTMRYADGSTREFYQIGLSANTAGFSVYIIGLEDKKYLAETYGEALGKASVTGYCIKFKSLSHINVDVLEAAIRSGIEQTSR